MITTMMNKKRGLPYSVSCPTMEIPGRPIESFSRYGGTLQLSYSPEKHVQDVFYILYIYIYTVVILGCTRVYFFYF